MMDVVKALRALPAVQPPSDLSRRIMDSLPHRRGFMGRVEYALRGSFSSRSQSLWLPSSPAELGLFVLSAGLFFCCLTAVIWLRLPFLGRQPAFLPTLAASLILMAIGWRQIRSTRRIITFWPGLAAACSFFAVTLSPGMFFGLLPGLELVTAWIGMFGLAVVAGIILINANARWIRGTGRERNPMNINRNGRISEV